MTDETIENIENVTETAPVSEAEAPEQEIVEEQPEVAEQGETAETEAEEVSTEEPEEAPEQKTYTKEELDAAAAGARKQGISQGKKEMAQQLNSGLESLYAAPDQLYDPATGQLMDPSNPVYNSVKQKLEEEATLNYNKRVQMEQQQRKVELQKQEQELKNIQTGFESQFGELKKTSPDRAKLIHDVVSRDLQGSEYDAMLSVAATTSGGLATLSNLIKDEPSKIEELSMMPQYKQAAEMSRLIDKHNKGAGDPIKKSKAPKPSGSFANGGATSAKKSPQNQSYEDIEAEYRAKLGIKE